MCPEISSNSLVIFYPLRPEILVNYIKASASAKVEETYDLVSHGESECWGSFDDSSTPAKGWGSAYENSCIHSGLITSSGNLATNWYNYTLATAGTIIDENTASSKPATNTTTATESICPKGWALPFKTQIDSNRNKISFSPVYGGHYSKGTLYNESTHGYWWGSEAYSGASRYGLRYDGSNLITGNYYRHYGFSIRCVSEEKTVTDLTYMQDILPALFLTRSRISKITENKTLMLGF